jgi:hypothetical protein
MDESNTRGVNNRVVRSLDSTFLLLLQQSKIEHFLLLVNMRVYDHDLR